MTTNLTMLLIVVMLGLFGTTGRVDGQEFSIFFPSEYENAESPATDSVAPVTWPNGARIQYAIPSDAFDSLPETHRWLTELRNAAG